MLQSWCPHGFDLAGSVEAEEGEAEGRGGQQGPRHLDQPVVQQTHLQDILRQRVLKHVNLASLRITPATTIRVKKILELLRSNKILI